MNGMCGGEGGRRWRCRVYFRPRFRRVKMLGCKMYYHDMLLVVVSTLRMRNGINFQPLHVHVGKATVAATDTATGS